MKLLNMIVSESIAGFKEMLFPEVCVCCGLPTHSDGNMMCPFCQDSAFDKAMLVGVKSGKGVILPNEIDFQYALWKYDKAGGLQKIMRMIKYGGMGRLGFELGVLVGSEFMKSTIWDQLVCQKVEPVLLPVPLHPKKKRYRGYNQAQLIATGVSEITGIPIMDEHIVVRNKFTITQTGQNLEGRMKNLQEAFKVQQPNQVSGKRVIIIDDVFTTGATAFALSKILKDSGMEKSGILTVCMA
jgi:ComF family protein